MQVCHVPKVDVPRFNTTTMWTPAFEWYVVRCGSKNACSKEIGQHAQNMLTILSSLVNMLWGTYMTT